MEKSFMQMVKFLTILFCILFSASAFGQDYSQLDPKPYDPATEPNIDMFISSWKQSMPRHTHGNLIERDIFTPCIGDPMKPVVPGAVITGIKRFSHAMLEPGQMTTPFINKDEQEIFYFDSGKGIIKSGNTTQEIGTGFGALIPPAVEYTITNTGTEPLGMYLMIEPIRPGFTPRKDILVRDEAKLPVQGTTGHWVHISKRLFQKSDGLSVLYGMSPVWFSPMTMGQPHSHGPLFVEEIWFALDGDINILLGKQLRKLPVGSAYKIPPDGKTPHSNINVSGDKTIKMFWLMKTTE